MRTTYIAAAATAVLTLAAGPALAHTGHAPVNGFASGFLHPLGGFDHLLAMVAVGAFAGLLGGRARWLVPASFLVMMAVGGALGLSGTALPFVELGIALSVVVVGGLVAFGAKPPVAVAMGVVGLFAVFHGHAHGAEAPLAASGVSYAAGFVIATALLHGAGLAATLALGERRIVARLGGGAAALAGLAITVNIL